MSGEPGIQQHERYAETKSRRGTFVTLPGTRTHLPRRTQPIVGEENIVPVKLADAEGGNYGTI